MAYKILISDPLHEEAIAWLQKQNSVELTVKPQISREELRQIIRQFDGIIVRSRTKIGEAEIQAAKRLKVIGRAGSGLDNIDVAFAQEHGIRVLNASGTNANAVAELTLALLLTVARDLHSAVSAAKAGKKFSPNGIELQGKMLGIIGFGHIGRRVAQLAGAFGAHLLITDPYLEPEERAKVRDVQFVGLDLLLSRSQFISLHVPLTEETFHMINAEAIARMKAGIYLINTARAEVVDEQAILDGLNNNIIKRYAADFAKSPELAAHERVIITPHIGASTEEAQKRAGLEIARKVLGVLKAQH